MTTIHLPDSVANLLYLEGTEFRIHRAGRHHLDWNFRTVLITHDADYNIETLTSGTGESIAAALSELAAKLQAREDMRR